jgi:hypothetical protein
MLRGNLSTRPFYNERAVQALLGGLAATLALVSLFTVWQFVVLTRQQGELSARIARDETRAAGLRREAQQVRSRIDARLLETTVKATREANTVIDERTFSWTALFNVFERTIPSEVRLRSVTPANDRGVLLVRFTVNAPKIEPVGQFLDRLEAAGAFARLRSVEEQSVDDGTYNVVCDVQYLGPGADPAAATPAENPAEAPSAPVRAGEH